MKIINFDNIIKPDIKKYYNKNKFVMQHPANSYIVGKTNVGKTNLLLTYMTLNEVFQYIFIFCKKSENKYDWLKNKFPDNVFIYENEINFDKIYELDHQDNQTLVVFDDLVFSNKDIDLFLIRSRKLNCSCIFIGHNYFSVSRVLRNNLHYILAFKLDKKDLTLIYNDISLDITKEKFYKIFLNLKPYEFILIDKKISNPKLMIRKNFDETLFD